MPWQVRLLQPTFQQESSVENHAKLHKVGCLSAIQSRIHLR